jgi:hypothetical protein
MWRAPPGVQRRHSWRRIAGSRTLSHIDTNVDAARQRRAPQ